MAPAREEKDGRKLWGGFLGSFIASLVGGGSFAGGVAYHIEGRIAVLEERLGVARKLLEENFEADRARRAFGPGGFSDGGIRSGLDSTIRAETQHLLPREEFQRALERLFDKNPELKK